MADYSSVQLIQFCIIRLFVHTRYYMYIYANSDMNILFLCLKKNIVLMPTQSSTKDLSKLQCLCDIAHEDNKYQVGSPSV